MTTSAIIAIVVVILLIAIGVGGWILSNRHSSPPAPKHTSSAPAPQPTASVLTPSGATAADNPQGAAEAIDGSEHTFWHTDFYIGNPVFGGLAKGTGLVLNMGKQVKVHQLQVLFGANVGANVQIKVSDSPVSPKAAEAVPTVAQASGVGNLHTFTLKHPATGQYVVIWFTRLPPKTGSNNQYQAEIYNVVVRGTG